MSAFFFPPSCFHLPSTYSPLLSSSKKDLSILACKPARHRSGAGSALLRWGVDKADREGKVAFLEASPAGYPLYRRFGWADVGVQDLDLASFGAKQGEGEDWGGEVAVALAGPKAEGVYRSALMKRVPKQTG